MGPWLPERGRTQLEAALHAERRGLKCTCRALYRPFVPIAPYGGSKLECKAAIEMDGLPSVTLYAEGMG